MGFRVQEQGQDQQVKRKDRKRVRERGSQEKVVQVVQVSGSSVSSGPSLQSAGLRQSIAICWQA